MLPPSNTRPLAEPHHGNSKETRGFNAENGSSTKSISPNNDEPLIHAAIDRCLAPVFLMVTTPTLVILLWTVATQHNGSFSQYATSIQDQNETYTEAVVSLWRPVYLGSKFAWALVGGYLTWAVFWTVALPGPTECGTLTPAGHIPKYKANGFRYYVLTMASFVAVTLVLRALDLPSPGIVYDHMGEILGTLNLLALGFCLLLYLKGIFWPNCADRGLSGNPVFDYYWGVELYPRVAGVDVKLVTNCRVGMMGWALLLCVHWLRALDQRGGSLPADSLTVSVLLQLIYITKFFWWEMGYMRTLDIILDRAGYYICWGCLVFIPGFYASPTLYMAGHPAPLGLGPSLGLLAGGLSLVGVNYWCDQQRQMARETEGRCHVWGRPAEIIRAKYTTRQGQERSSILLVSGFWSWGRHFNYVPESLQAFVWSLAASVGGGEGYHVLPFLYPCFLFLLLVHRTHRDDQKCLQKYGRYWVEYQQRVPYHFIPYVY